jgi:hypothetical protein
MSGQTATQPLPGYMIHNNHALLGLPSWRDSQSSENILMHSAVVSCAGQVLDAMQSRSLQETLSDKKV